MKKPLTCISWLLLVLSGYLSLTAQISAVLCPLRWHPLWDSSLDSPSRRHPVLGAPIAVAYPFLAVFIT